MRKPTFARAAAGCLVGLTILASAGCERELTTTELSREIRVLPDGDGLVTVVTSYASTNTSRLAQELAFFSRDEAVQKWTQLGFQSVEFEIQENARTQAVVQTRARFEDWSVLPRWLFGAVEGFDPEQHVIASRGDGQVLLNFWLPNLCPTNEADRIEGRSLMLLKIIPGEAVVLESNADEHDPHSGELRWSAERIVCDGVSFHLQIPNGQ